MNATKTQFSNLNGYIIQNERYKSDILNSIIKKYNVNIFSNYDRKYSDHIIPALQKYNILACIITYGKPYILYFTKIFNENVCLMIDKKINSAGQSIILSIPISCSDTLFNGTILSGELVRHNSKKWEFVIEKTLVYNSKVTKINNHIENVKICLDIIQQFKSHRLTPFDISVKIFTTLSKLDNLVKNSEITPIGFKLYGLKNPIVYYFSNRHTYNIFQFQTPKLLDYDSNKIIMSEKEKIINSFNNNINDGQEVSSSSDVISKLDINIEKEFCLILTKSDTYGIYNILCDKDIIGVSRITTIELQDEIRKCLKTIDKVMISAYYDYNFEKWAVIRLLSKDQFNKTNLEKVQEHVKRVKLIPKDDYLYVD